MTELRSTIGNRYRRRLTVRGTVQGVGFRPFVYRLATELGLAGSVHNAGDGVTIEIEGESCAIEQFSGRLRTELPPLAQIIDLRSESVPPTGVTVFTIIATDRTHHADTFIPPDIATCDECRADMFDLNNRRFRYPFTNCTNCGPRYTIVESIPYDRPYTSMRHFPMCPDCEREYHDPKDRRFHAQPNACPVCGPSLTLHCITGEKQDVADPIAGTLAHLKAGRVVAIKGIGGFHLAVDPFNEEAVAQLRRRKGRADKPFALMAASLEIVKRHCEVSREEELLLRDVRRPIVLLRARPDTTIAPSVAPSQKYLGFMLPYSPLHHLLLGEGTEALVMTSANLAEEPIVIGNDEAFDRLRQLADFVLVHNRDIVQRCDDSVTRVIAGYPQIIRRSRGFVPQPVLLKQPLRHLVLAVGPELKNVVGIGRRDAVVLSQHIGDLDNPSALGFFTRTIEHLQQVLQFTPEIIACDMHPEYLATKWARGQRALPVVAVQHHHAHLVSVMADNGRTEPAIGIILDGTGYGTDGTIWGGEVLIGDAHGFQRFAWLDPVPMAGGSAAIRAPWRMAAGYLQHTFGDEYGTIANRLLTTVPMEQMATVGQMIARRINSPMTSSCGRLFDGIAALLGLRSEITYDAQAAIELEMAVRRGEVSDIASIELSPGAIDVRPLIRELVRRRLDGDDIGSIAAWFHATVAEMFLAAAKAAREATGLSAVALGGGVFHNATLLEVLSHRLRKAGFTVLTARQVPPNDGGLALGQVVIADAQYRK